MRVCSLHIESAIETWVCRQTGEELDLCGACSEMVRNAARGMYETTGELEPAKKDRPKKNQEVMKDAGRYHA